MANYFALCCKDYLDSELKSFYDRQYSTEGYATADRPDQHSSHKDLVEFIKKYDLSNKRCLEVGAGRGAFQDLVADYIGTDVSDTVRRYFHKAFVQTPATELPFSNDSFDAIWSIAVLEHVSDPESALSEMRRVLRNGGLLYLAPAWQCRSWAAKGYPVRPYSDLTLAGKLIKASIPLRNSVIYRSMFVFPRRAVRALEYLLYRTSTSFRYRKLTPNYERYWMPDSDAVNSMDPFDAILWFCSRGDKCLSHPTARRKFLVRTGPLVLRIAKS